jgi:hypothetical protein
VPDPLPIEESELFEVSPNPFRDELKITVGIEKPSFAKVDLFDLQGRHLASIYDDEFPPGERTFTVDPDVLAQLPAATYVVLLRTHGGFRKIWVVKQ